MSGEGVKIDPSFAISSSGIGERDELEECLIAVSVLGDQDDIAGVFFLGVVGHLVDESQFYSDDRFDICLLTCLVELYCPIHAIVVSQCNCLHT